MFPCIETLSVKRSQNIGEEISGFALDHPKAGERSDSFSIGLSGWVVGRKCRAVEIAVILEQRLVAKAPIDVQRRDVAARQPGGHDPETSGFKTEISISGMPTALELELFVVFADASQTRLAVIKLRSFYFYRYFYFVNHNHRFIYCSIPKNACTLFKTFTLEHSDDSGFQKGGDVHAYLARNVTPVTFTDPAVLEGSEYFKFAVLRNPFERLVSAYLDKFVQWLPKPEKFAFDVIQHVHDSNGLDGDYSKSITFSQFIHYLAETPPVLLDRHWRPQFLYLAETHFDHIGQFENIDGTISYIEKKFGLAVTRQVSKHKIAYSDDLGEATYQDLYGRELKRLKLRPRAKNLFTPELAELVAQKYAKDLEVYRAMFPGSTGRPQARRDHFQPQALP
jgi:hypothetical protein